MSFTSSLAASLRSQKIDTRTLEPIGGFGTDVIHRLIVHGSTSLELWHELRAVADKTGHWPVIMGDEQTVEDMIHRQEFFEGETTEEILAQAETTSVADWLASERDIRSKWMQIVEDPKTPDFIRESYRDMLARFDTFSLPLQTQDSTLWPADVGPIHQFAGPFNLEGIVDRLSIGLVPVRFGWQVPAVLCFGHFNSCPHPSAHVRLLKHWNITHGAELVTMTTDTIELRILRPIDPDSVSFPRQKFGEPRFSGRGFGARFN